MKLGNISTHDLIVSLQQNCSPRSRELMVDELLRREQLLAVNIKMIEDRLAAYEADERGHYPIATVFENAPLALIQLKLETGKQELGWVLKLLNDNKDGE
jgi:hypothetical protein